ncbi:MAG TPA: putative FMN-dependent luciferase-like monooxygenase [Propionicimonas sp.]|jgi:putative FMN-dependent luciferase-like monooxygenase|uniref:putative FMN-dependent luciferase-like monooxygenase n=1 Tax=Propionicimonas sp. TaxID=1955623 RepID=UPI002F40D2E3
MTGVKLGFFTRLLERAPAADRYWFAAEQARHAEQLGFETVWVAQHHFHADEGGLPSPFVFLSHLAARTTRIRLATGVITLPLENVVRVAEDAIVADLLSGGRLELGLGSGSTPASFAAFGVDPADRAQVYSDGVEQLVAALGGRELSHPENRLYPEGASLLDRVWQATFSAFGGTRAGAPGHGLLLSRTQPRPEGEPDLPLDVLQQPIVDAYLAALPEGIAPRILASRTLVVTDTEAEAEQYLQAAWERYSARPGTGGFFVPADDARTWARRTDTHIGTAGQVIAALAADPIIPQSTEVAFQVHSIDPGHEATLRSLDLIAHEVAPALGWGSTLTGASPVAATAR